ncbi:MAG: aryl-sulfate sulfotransferase, partial [Terriglobales bacterium]
MTKILSYLMLALAMVVPVSGVSAQDKAPAFTAAPSVQRNPNARVPLAAVLSFSADRKVATSVEISDGSRIWEILFDDSRDPLGGLPLLGLRPNRQHRIHVSIRDAAGRTTRAPGVIEYTTPPLPAGVYDFPPITVVKSEPARMEPGFTLLSVRRYVPGKIQAQTQAQRRFSEQWGMIVALDAEGEVVWYYQEDARIAGIDRLKNGNLFYLLTDSRSVEIDPLGNKVSEIYAAKRPQGPVKGAIPI